MLILTLSSTAGSRRRGSLEIEVDFEIRRSKGSEGIVRRGSFDVVNAIWRRRRHHHVIVGVAAGTLPIQQNLQPQVGNVDEMTVVVFRRRTDENIEKPAEGDPSVGPVQYGRHLWRWWRRRSGRGGGR